MPAAQSREGQASAGPQPPPAAQTREGQAGEAEGERGRRTTSLAQGWALEIQTRTPDFPDELLVLSLSRDYNIVCAATPQVPLAANSY